MHLAQHIIVIYFILRSEFSQGGFNADSKGWRDMTTNDRTGKVSYSISFKGVPAIVIPLFRIKESKTESPVIANVIHSSLTKTSFEYTAYEVGGGVQSCIMEYVAIGI